jgi:hypothetical protein
MPLLAGESHLKYLAALEAANRHRHWEFPFHKHVLFAAGGQAQPPIATEADRKDT